jgi:hypothetical protein
MIPYLVNHVQAQNETKVRIGMTLYFIRSVFLISLVTKQEYLYLINDLYDFYGYASLSSPMIFLGFSEYKYSINFLANYQLYYLSSVTSQQTFFSLTTTTLTSFVVYLTQIKGLHMSDVKCPFLHRHFGISTLFRRLGDSEITRVD